MDYLASAISWINIGLLTWLAAAMLGGLLILLAERFDRRREPSDTDVKRAASRYRKHYRAHALNALGDHMMAASFAPDSRHRRFLKRVYAEISPARSPTTIAPAPSSPEDFLACPARDRP